ncbi:MAG: guanylate kinase [Myxococcales bacterium]|nr:guanylate kinase [Myxococcales bacterium]
MAGAEEFLTLIVSSPSGAGKTTLCERLRRRVTDLRFSVSHTTRTPRPSEVDGREYHFVDDAAFGEMVSAGRFAEWAVVHGRSYGTAHSEVDHARRTANGILFDIDFQGARQIKARVMDAVSVFILPPSLTELERRLRGRGTEDEPTTRRRLANAKREIAHYGLFDYVVVNDDLDRAEERIVSIVIAERCRRARHADRCEALLARAREATLGEPDA